MIGIPLRSGFGLKHEAHAHPCFVVTFWTIAFAFVALDWSRATPHNRFDEPPPWQLGQDNVEGAGPLRNATDLDDCAR